MHEGIDPEPDNSSDGDQIEVHNGSIADLSVTATSSVDPVLVGGVTTITDTISNAGPATATNLELYISGGESMTAPAASGWTCTDLGGEWRCLRPALANDASSVITFDATASATAGYTFATGQISSDEFDPTAGSTLLKYIDINTPDTANLSAVATTAAVAPGANALVQVTVSNAGPDAAVNTRVWFSFDTASVELVTAASSAGCYEGDGFRSAICSISAPIPPGGSATVTLALKTAVVGSWPVQIWAESDAGDLTVGNPDATTTVTASNTTTTPPPPPPAPDPPPATNTRSIAFNKPAHLKVSGKRKLKLTGTIKATATFASCTAKVTVAIQRFYSGSWHTIKTATTTSTGTFSYVAADKTGKYRVTATKFTKAGTPQHICTAATSASRTHSD